MTSPTQYDSYLDDPRDNFAHLLPAAAGSVADIGCGPGGFGRTLRHQYPEARIVGVEAVASQAGHARVDHGYDEVIDGYYPEALADRPEKFDLICFIDVLEHIIDPWAVVEGLHRHLNPGGIVFAAIPNVQLASNITDLLQGRWEYTDTGLLDRTHVRFFTRATAVSLFTEHGYAVDACDGANPMANYGPPPKRALRSLIMRVAPDSRYLHFVIQARSLRA